MQILQKAKKETRKFTELPISVIRVSKNQTRTKFDEYELSLLCESIKQNGLLQPITVRRADGGYELIAGERRLRACKQAGLKTIPAIIYELDSVSAALFTLIENLQRSDLSCFEEAEGIKRLITTYNMPQCEAAERLGISPSTLSNKLRILKLTDSQKDRIEAARLTERHARAVLRLKEEMRDTALDIIIANSLTVKESEKLADELQSKKEEKKTPQIRASIGDVRLFANSLSKIVDTMIKAGYSAKTKKSETDSYIEYTVRIDKQSAQLRLI